MNVKEFKQKSIPEFNFNIKKEKHVLVQCFFSKSELASKLIGIEKQATEIKNAFKVLQTGPNSSYSVRDIVSVPDNLVDRPIVSYKHPEGNNPNGEARPVFGSYLQGMMPFSFYCHKLEETEEALELTFLIPEDVITVKHNI
jgi:hypothetical protein